MIRAGLIRGRVELSPTGWCLEWMSSVNEGQFNRRKRRRYKKALKSLTLDQMMEIIERMLARHESFLEQHRSLTAAVQSDTLPR